MEPVEQPDQTFGQAARYAGASERVTVEDGVVAECRVMEERTERKRG